MNATETFGLVIFDMDGVLVDSEILSCRAFQQTMARHGVEITEAEIHRRFIGTSSQTAIRALLGEDIEAAKMQQIAQELKDDALRQFEGNLQPIADAAMVINDLRVPAAVASSSSPERIQGSLTMTGLYDLLAPNLFSASMVENGKPAPDLFLLAASKMAVDPKRCLVIEDSAAGVSAGKTAGMTVLGFTGGSHATDERYAEKLYDAGADKVIERLQDIHLALKQGPRQSRHAL